MNALLATASQVQGFCDARGWPNCIIGGIAVLRWGEPRVTRDVDVALLTGFGREENFIDPLLEAYAGRSTDARAFALRTRVLLLRAESGAGIDISLAALPFEQLAIERASVFDPSPGLRLRTCSAEDLVVFKLFASRPQDLQDAKGIAVRHRDTLDWDYVATQLSPLAELKEAPEILAAMERLRQIR
jgi:hypothetical protein